jgi:hypothetical protein
MGSAGRTIAFAALLAWQAGAAIAQESGASAIDRCEGDTRQRLRFIEDHLDDKRTYAQRWMVGWNTVYSAGIVVGGGQAWMADDRGDRAAQVVSAVKSTIGLVQSVLDPPPARLGTRDLRTIPTDTAEDCARRLARAEEILRENAEKSREERFSWKPHAGNVALNLAGALIVSEGFGDETAAWQDGALGFVVGEGRIWSYPWHADGALREYERRFPASGVPQPPETTWHIESWGAGARFVLRY